MTTPQGRILNALEVIYEYGGIDGDHHKAWVLDQIVQCLCKDEAEYQQFVEDFEGGEDGPKTYEWDRGIAP